MPGSCASVLSVSCVLMSACATAELDCREPRKCELDCAYSCAHHNCVTDITCACLCCTCFFSSARNILSLRPVRLIICKLSELYFKDLFWIWVTPQYLLGSQLVALKHTGRIRCNAHHVHTLHAGAENLLFCSTLTACFSFAVGSPGAGLKVGSLGNTCGLDVQFAKNIHPLFLTYKVHRHALILAFFLAHGHTV